MKIGIPRGLLYSIYLPLWKTFLEELGHKVVLSSHTDQTILNNGVKTCVDDACLPVKIFHGHVMNLVNKADIILIPRLVSVCPGEFICPKFIGLPEMIKHSIPGDLKLLVMNFNARFQMEKGYDGMRTAGRELGASKELIDRALRKARMKQDEHRRMMETVPGLNPVCALEKRNQKPLKSAKGVIGLIGHPYLIYDQYINMNLCNKFRARGYDLLFPENIPLNEINQECERYPKKLFWSYGKRLLGSGLSMLQHKRAVGLILVTSFGCGIDSFMDELLIRANQRVFKIPLTTLTLDEHSGQAGFDTRLEAFVDMMEWRSRYDNYVSTHGTGIHPSQSFI